MPSREGQLRSVTALAACCYCLLMLVVTEAALSSVNDEGSSVLDCNGGDSSLHSTRGGGYVLSPERKARGSTLVGHSRGVSFNKPLRNHGHAQLSFNSDILFKDSERKHDYSGILSYTGHTLLVSGQVRNGAVQEPGRSSGVFEVAGLTVVGVRLDVSSLDLKEPPIVSVKGMGVYQSCFHNITGSVTLLDILCPLSPDLEHLSSVAKPSFDFSLSAKPLPVSRGVCKWFSSGKSVALRQGTRSSSNITVAVSIEDKEDPYLNMLGSAYTIDLDGTSLGYIDSGEEGLSSEVQIPNTEGMHTLQVTKVNSACSAGTQGYVYVGPAPLVQSYGSRLTLQQSSQFPGVNGKSFSRYTAYYLDLSQPDGQARSIGLPSSFPVTFQIEDSQPGRAYVVWVEASSSDEGSILGTTLRRTVYLPPDFPICPRVSASLVPTQQDVPNPLTSASSVEFWIQPDDGDIRDLSIPSWPICSSVSLNQPPDVGHSLQLRGSGFVVSSNYTANSRAIFFEDSAPPTTINQWTTLGYSIVNSAICTTAFAAAGASGNNCIYLLGQGAVQQDYVFEVTMEGGGSTSLAGDRELSFYIMSTNEALETWGVRFKDGNGRFSHNPGGPTVDKYTVFSPPAASPSKIVVRGDQVPITNDFDINDVVAVQLVIVNHPSFTMVTTHIDDIAIGPASPSATSDSIVLYITFKPDSFASSRSTLLDFGSGGRVYYGDNTDGCNHLWYEFQGNITCGPNTNLPNDNDWNVLKLKRNNTTSTSVEATLNNVVVANSTIALQMTFLTFFVGEGSGGAPSFMGAIGDILIREGDPDFLDSSFSKKHGASPNHSPHEWTAWDFRRTDPALNVLNISSAEMEVHPFNYTGPGQIGLSHNYRGDATFASDHNSPDNYYAFQRHWYVKLWSWPGNGGIILRFPTDKIWLSYEDADDPAKLVLLKRSEPATPASGVAWSKVTDGSFYSFDGTPCTPYQSAYVEFIVVPYEGYITIGLERSPNHLLPIPGTSPYRWLDRANHFRDDAGRIIYHYDASSIPATDIWAPADGLACVRRLTPRVGDPVDLIEVAQADTSRALEFVKKGYNLPGVGIHYHSVGLMRIAGVSPPHSGMRSIVFQYKRRSTNNRDVVFRCNDLEIALGGGCDLEVSSPAGDVCAGNQNNMGSTIWTVEFSGTATKVYRGFAFQGDVSQNLASTCQFDQDSTFFAVGLRLANDLGDVVWVNEGVDSPIVKSIQLSLSIKYQTGDASSAFAPPNSFDTVQGAACAAYNTGSFSSLKSYELEIIDLDVLQNNGDSLCVGTSSGDGTNSTKFVRDRVQSDNDFHGVTMRLEREWWFQKQGGPAGGTLEDITVRFQVAPHGCTDCSYYLIRRYEGSNAFSNPHKLAFNETLGIADGDTWANQIDRQWITLGMTCGSCPVNDSPLTWMCDPRHTSLSGEYGFGMAKVDGYPDPHPTIYPPLHVYPRTGGSATYDSKDSVGVYILNTASDHSLAYPIDAMNMDPSVNPQWTIVMLLKPSNQGSVFSSGSSGPDSGAGIEGVVEGNKWKCRVADPEGLYLSAPQTQNLMMDNWNFVGCTYDHHDNGRVTVINQGTFGADRNSPLGAWVPRGISFGSAYLREKPSPSRDNPINGQMKHVYFFPRLLEGHELGALAQHVQEY